MTNWNWKGIKHTLVKFNQLHVPSGNFVYLAGSDDTTTIYGTEYNNVQGLQKGQTDTDIRVLGEQFHPDHRLETTAHVTFICGLNRVAIVIHDFGSTNHGSSINYIIDLTNRSSYCPIFP